MLCGAAATPTSLMKQPYEAAAFVKKFERGASEYCAPRSLRLE